MPYMPHAESWKAAAWLIWTVVIVHGLTFLSFSIICVTLLLLVRNTRRVIARDWPAPGSARLAAGFALFLAATGCTYLLEVVTIWLPWFWVALAMSVITALLSAYVAVTLIWRLRALGSSINDYARRLANTEQEKGQMLESLMAAQKLEDWSRMSAVVSHEIANPLEAVQNLLYLIRETDGVSPQVADFAQTAADETDRVLTISRSTLSFFRQGSRPEPIDLRGAADSVCVLLERSMREKGIALRIETRGDVVVEALPGEPRQVLLNLVRNACEATRDQGADVHILLTGQEAGVEVIVADQGSGMDAAVLSQLFQFGVTTKGERGNGMGLWSVKHILARHGGEVRVESRSGEGTRFVLWWPRHAAITQAVTQ